MNIQSMRKEIRELRNSLLYKYEPVCKAFILGTEDSPPAEEIEAYRQAHPRTHIVILFSKDCGEGSTF
jgi:hypothetical protein